MLYWGQVIDEVWRYRFYIVQLFIAGNFWLGLAYSLFFIPYATLSLILVATAALLGIGEVGIEEQILVVDADAGSVEWESK